MPDGDYLGYTGSAGSLLASLQDRTQPAIKPKYRESYSEKSALIPADIRTSRDARRIADYLDANPLGTDRQPLNPDARQQLIHRIANLAYYDRLAEKFSQYTENNNYTDYTGNAQELLDYLREMPEPMKKPTIKVPFVKDSMNLPLRVNCTGDADVIANYLDNQPTDYIGEPLNSAARRHLIDRMVNSVYVSRRAEEFRDKKYQPLPPRELPNGYILESLHQPEAQGTNHCCWTMPVKLMLQSRGIDLDQESIRCYKPELSQKYIGDNIEGLLRDDPNRESVANDDVDAYTKDVNGVSCNLAPLINKFVPNCAMVNHTFVCSGWTPEKLAESRQVQTAMMKQAITTALSEYHSPVGICNGSHYRTIVGIDGDDVILKDSYFRATSDTNKRVPLSSLLRNNQDKIDMYYLRDMSVTAADKLPEELEELNKRDPSTYSGLDAAQVKQYGDHFKAVDIPKEGSNKGKLTITAPELIYTAGTGNAEQPVINCTQNVTVPLQGRSVNEALITVVYLPPQLNDKAITLQMPQAARSEELSLPAANPVNTSRSYAVSDRIAQESSYLAELPDNDFKRIQDIGNDARMELRQHCTAPAGESAEAKQAREESIRRCMLSMLYARQVEADRAVRNGKPGNLEKSFSQNVDMDTLLQNETLQKLCQRCPDPSKMTVKDAEDFILNDTAGKLVRQELMNTVDKSKELSESKRAVMKGKILNGTDPNHETERLKMLYQKLNDADPLLMRSSAEFKAMKKNLENVIKLREARTDLLSGNLTPDQKQQGLSDLTKAYLELGKSAQKYMSIKDPTVLKPGSTAKARFDAAGAVISFAAELKEVHAEKLATMSQPSKAPQRTITAPKKAKELA